MKTIKPMRVSVLHRTFENEHQAYLVVTPMLFFGYDALRDPRRGEAGSPDQATKLLHEVDLWRTVASELGSAGVLDAGMLKLRGEVLVSGRAYPPNGPQPACQVGVRIGSVDKSLYVVGDRTWGFGGSSEPVPFTEMPITWDNAFGGAAYAMNPRGKGFAPIKTDAGETHPLPNVELPNKLLKSPGDRPPPAGFGAYDFAWPQRFSKIGTYDRSYVETRAPGFAADMDWGIFNTAPEDQQLEGYFAGDEEFALEHLHPTRHLVEGRLPGMKTRCFVNQKVGDALILKEIETRLDTVLFFPHLERAALIYRGVAKVAEDDAADVEHLVVAAELAGHPKPAEHYRDVLAQRLDRRGGRSTFLREEDLLPPDQGTTQATFDELSPPDVRVANSGARQQYVHARLTKHLEEARAQLVANDLDASKMPASIPTLEDHAVDDVPALREALKARGETTRADGKLRITEAELTARADLASRGGDYDERVREAEIEAGGPPKFRADEQLASYQATLDVWKEKGKHAPELDPGRPSPLARLEAKLSDPKLGAQLHGFEQALQDGYRGNAHMRSAASRLEGDAAARVRAKVEAARAAGESLAGQDLTGAVLPGIDLSGADLRRTLLESADLSGADLSGADLRESVLARCDLADANLAGANLAGANLGLASLTGADLSEADLTSAILTKADLSDAVLRGATLQRVDLGETTLAGADLSGLQAANARFYKMDLTGIPFGGADLTKATFLECDVSGAIFEGAKMNGATFVTCKGAGARFMNAACDKLRFVHGSAFPEADFRGASLELANLRSSDLAGCDFSGATAKQADFSESNLRGAKFYRTIAKEARFMKSDLTGANMVSINLMSGSLMKAKLAGADFKGANLFQVDLGHSVGDAATSFEGANVKRVRVLPRRTDG